MGIGMRDAMRYVRHHADTVRAIVWSSESRSLPLSVRDAGSKILDEAISDEG